MSLFILFYLWIVPIVIGIVCSAVAYKSKGKMRVAPGIAMIVFSIISLVTAFTAGRTNFHVFIGGMFLFGTFLVGSAFPFFFGLKKKEK
ncbi:hypothetical protein ACHADS_20055 [Bacillus vallismortis]|uniref:hypothetical protein n=1 Tax=Bacillus vallismortis TaxID=72361 RepID=UPI00374D9585